ncbi:response regulator [Pedobacter sp. SD-b]|uniref:histidine kinase n=1 Tax=Pedobacter segetis TaxID=2793069 RepID=A0ABS1BLZ5_9SPHI|nr:two-component regulator propeller domain-containing protein [Pedobacter segetis]MBK0383914.1 response regulator [Pedobacter segetis]
MNNKKYYFIILLFFLSLISEAQTLNFKHISFKEGLAQSPISCFLQDQEGFIWFGNLKGLTRYDGYELKKFSFDINNPHTISNNRVNAILQDSKHQIWIGTSNGLNLYNRNLETFTHIDILEIKGGRNYISSIVEDKQKNIWVGTFGGLKKLNKKTLKLEELGLDTNEPNFKNFAVHSLFVDKDNKIWIGTSNGLKLFDPATGLTRPLPNYFYQNKDFVNNKIFITKQDAKGNLWFGTEISGVFKASSIDQKITNYLFDSDKNSIASNWVKDILIDGADKIWFATRNGISILNTKNDIFNNYKHEALNPNSLNDNTIWSLLKDKNQCIWVGTFAGGINFYYKGNSNFQNIGESVGKSIGLNHVLVNAITEDPDGLLWVGTFGGGLNLIDRKKGISRYYSINNRGNTSSSNGVKSLADDGKGNLWVGSLNGLGLFNKDTKSYKPYNFKLKNGSLIENLIMCVLPDKDGVWVGTDGGGLMYVLYNGKNPLVLVKDAGIKNKPYLNNLMMGLNKTSMMGSSLKNLNSNKIEGLSDNFLTSLCKDGNDHLWIGTQNGLNYYDIKNKKVLSIYQKVRDTKFQLSNSNVNTIFKDSKNRLWVGTEEGGLNYFDKKDNRFYSIKKNEGLRDDVIHAIVEDKNGNLWLSTDLGICKIHFKKFKLPFQKEDLVIKTYTSNDGLTSNQFSTNAGLRLHTNEIAFGGLNGLSIFYPDKIIKNTAPPKVIITQLLINNKTPKIGEVGSPLSKSITETNKIELAYDQSSFSIKYAALNFIDPDNNIYAYKLDGLPRADEWQNIGKQRVVNFANLSPGSYLFKVKAANSDKVWGYQICALKIIVLPPWWATWWAYLVYVIALSFVLAIIIKFLRNRARLKRDLYLEHVHNIRQEELYQMKLNFFTNISHEIRTPLTLILGPLDKILRNSAAHDFAKPLSTIKNNADRLMKLVTELLDFRKAEEGHMKIHCLQEDIVLFCKKIFDSFVSIANDNKIDYQFIVSSEPILIYFDQNQLEKVLFNLLSNAFKFTPEKGAICLIIENSNLNEGWVDIKIVDNGKGIPKDMQPKLFESFFQVDDRGGHNIGSGIGLALSKSIVELHKGTIKVNSDIEPNSLTSFIISLRKGNAHLDKDEIVAESDLPYINKSDSTNDLITLIDDLPTSSRNSKKHTILIAEDNDEVRKLVVDLLVERYKVLQFPNAEAALASMENEIPDLIISDIMMPGMDGLDFCKNVKLKENSSHIPFILLTARASLNHQIDGLSIGADAYLSKPFSPQILELNIKNLLHAQEVMRQKFGHQFVLQPSAINIVSPEEKFLNKLMNIIESKIEDPTFDVNELVNEIGMSRTVLYKKVQALTGYAVADLIKQIRLKKAAELFKQRSYSVAEVAYMVGFNDRKHFSKEFKKFFELSPSEFIQKFSFEN